MWKKALSTLRCPCCRGDLRLVSFESGALGDGWVAEGCLTCAGCRALFPISRGVPMCLTYPTTAATEVVERWPNEWRRAIPDAFSLPHKKPPRGEQEVAESFSAEWLAYDYGNTLWTASTDDRVATFEGECGLKRDALRGKLYCEIGCGLGVTTNHAAEQFGATAWGLDLSAAVLRAAARFGSNDRLNFVQASVFAPPFSDRQFEFLYTHGVLHHTWSTADALARAAALVAEGGALYVWVYGNDDVARSWTRRLAFGVEGLLRPILARAPVRLATACLLPTIPVYRLASAKGIKLGTHGIRYTNRQALHAARDRFTPLFAHRHDVEEVREWLRRMGFSQVERVSPLEVPSSWSVAMEYNVALRATKLARSS